MRSQTVAFLGKLAIFLGAGAVLFAVAGVESISFPEYTLYSFSAAAGITLVIGGLISLAGSIVN
jgi:uncharacterized membrane protein HdeD (DUF308 family)